MDRKRPGRISRYCTGQSRDKAAETRVLIAEGNDPRLALKAKVEPAAREAAAEAIGPMESEWSNAKRRNQWEQTLGPAYCALIEDRETSEIGLDDMLAVLTPVWQKKPETASRLRGRLERVLNFAKTKLRRTGENPATWRGNLGNVLPRRDMKKAVMHLPAHPDGEAPAFPERLQDVTGTSARP